MAKSSISAHHHDKGPAGAGMQKEGLKEGLYPKYMHPSPRTIHQSKQNNSIVVIIPPKGCRRPISLTLSLPIS